MQGNLGFPHRLKEGEMQMKRVIMKNWFTTVLFCLLAIVVSFAIYNITHELLTYVHVEQRLAETIGRLLASIGIVLVYSRILDLKSFGLQKQNFFSGILTGGFMFVVMMLNALDAIVSVSEKSIVMPSVYMIVIVIIEQIFVGIFEEFLFRGLVLNTLLAKTESQGFKEKWIAIVISSFLFGIVHLWNLFSEPKLINFTLAQVFYAVFIGIFLGVLYLRTENIWVVVFYHALVDVVSELPGIFYGTADQTAVDISVSDAFISAGANIIFVFVALFLARKRKKSAI